MMGYILYMICCTIITTELAESRINIPSEILDQNDGKCNHSNCQCVDRLVDSALENQIQKCNFTYPQNHSCVEDTPITFNGKTSFAYVELETTLAAIETGSLAFRTRQNSGTLTYIQFYSRNDTIVTSLEFRLDEEKIKIIVVDNETNTLKFSPLMANGMWHHIEWHLTESGLMVDINRTSMNFTQFSDVEQATSVKLYVGAKPLFGGAIYKTSYFHGCMKGITINKKILNFSKENDTEFQDTVDITTGCLGDDICQQSQCPEYSFCEDIWNDYLCTCFDGWSGIFCNESTNDCINNLCSDGSTCLDGHMTYSCQCGLGKTGRFCEDFVFACDDHPCNLNNTEACVDIFPLDFSCHCREGWTGKNCSEKISECLSFPCKNQGSCINMVDGFKCECPTDFTGVNCDTKILCTNESCRNGGTCIPDEYNSAYLCICPSSYKGDNCELDYNECISDPCWNNATCINSFGGFHCNCTETGHRGELCEHDVDECLTGSHLCGNHATCLNTYGSYYCSCALQFTGVYCDLSVQDLDDQNVSNNLTIIISSILILTILLIIGTYGLWYVKKNRKMHGQYKPSQEERVISPGIPLDKMLNVTTGERLI